MHKTAPLLSLNRVFSLVENKQENFGFVGKLEGPLTSNPFFSGKRLQGPYDDLKGPRRQTDFAVNPSGLLAKRAVLPGSRSCVRLCGAECGPGKRVARKPFVLFASWNFSSLLLLFSPFSPFFLEGPLRNHCSAGHDKKQSTCIFCLSLLPSGEGSTPEARMDRGYHVSDTG